MELKNNKSAWAALATLGVTAIAAGTTAFVKIRRKRRERREQEEQNIRLSPEQMMVYNEAVNRFINLNNRIYELRQYQGDLKPLMRRLALQSEDAFPGSEFDDINRLAKDIEKFLTSQVPFTNACLDTICNEPTTYADCIHAPFNGKFDATLDEESTHLAEEGTPIKAVLKLGYFFPESPIAPYPVKSIVIV